MSALGVTALALVGAWLGMLTLLLILAIRQIGLLTVRLDPPRPQPGSQSLHEVVNDGLKIGMEVPAEVTTAVPECVSGHAYLLLISSICTPCRELVVELQRRRFTPADPMVALVPGRPEAADGVIAMLPTGIRAIRDPAAGVLAQEHLRLRSTPFALLIEDGVLVGKAFLHTVDDLVRFINARATSDASEIARRTKQAKEVMSHGA